MFLKISRPRLGDGIEELVPATDIGPERVLHPDTIAKVSSFFILEEDLQLRPLESKIIVTRMSRVSILVIVGNPAVNDTPYVNRCFNRLVHTRYKMRCN